MNELPISITIVLAVLTVFLCFVAALKYTVDDNFVRVRLIMTAFFCFIVITLSVSFWQYALATVPFVAPAALVGVAVGYFVGVKTEQQKLKAQGLAYYMEHFADINASDVKALTWWSVINYYSIMGGLLLINFVGLSTVIFRGAEGWAIATSMVGAFLLGTIVPYLLHLWSVRAQRHQ